MGRQKGSTGAPPCQGAALSKARRKPQSDEPFTAAEVLASWIYGADAWLDTQGGVEVVLDSFFQSVKDMTAAASRIASVHEDIHAVLAGLPDSDDLSRLCDAIKTAGDNGQRPATPSRVRHSLPPTLVRQPSLQPKAAIFGGNGGRYE